MSSSGSKSAWEAFRREIIELDGGVCVRCKRCESEGAVLQIHHREYLQGCLPWNFPYNLCETLCKGCHAETHGKIPPKSGWEYLSDEDLGDLCETCDYCDETETKLKQEVTEQELFTIRWKMV